MLKGHQIHYICMSWVMPIYITPGCIWDRGSLSHLKSHLFTYNLVDSPLCGCGLEPETVDHFILRYPTFGIARIDMYHTMVDILDNHLLTTLTRDSDIVNLFLFGHTELSFDKKHFGL